MMQSFLYFIYNLIFKSSKSAAAVLENTTFVLFTARHRTFASIGGRQLIAQLLFFLSFPPFSSHSTHREHGVVGDMRDAWPNSRVRKNAPLIRTYHGFKGTKVAPMDCIGCV